MPKKAHTSAVLQPPLGLPGISRHAAWQHQLAPWGHVGHHLRAPLRAVMGFLSYFFYRYSVGK